MSGEKVDLKDIPYYIFNTGSDYRSEYEYIKGKCNIENLMGITEIIEEKTVHESGVGRKNIEEALKSRNRNVTEAEIRTNPGINERAWNS